MTLIEKLENEKKSLNYHLKALRERENQDENIIFQINKIEKYLEKIDEKIASLKSKLHS